MLGNFMSLYSSAPAQASILQVPLQARINAACNFCVLVIFFHFSQGVGWMFSLSIDK